MHQTCSIINQAPVTYRASKLKTEEMIAKWGVRSNGGMVINRESRKCERERTWVTCSFIEVCCFNCRRSVPRWDNKKSEIVIFKLTPVMTFNVLCTAREMKRGRSNWSPACQRHSPVPLFLSLAGSSLPLWSGWVASTYHTYRSALVGLWKNWFRSQKKKKKRWRLCYMCPARNRMSITAEFVKLYFE